MKYLKILLAKLRKPKPYLLDGKFEIVPAFDWEGKTYYMHKDPLNTLAGRGMTALVFMEELLMRCDASFLRDYVLAQEKILSNSKSINITELVKLNLLLKERTELLIAVPKHVLKFASVVFFTKDESPYRYDFKAGQEKIRKWEAAGDMYAFFLQTPLKDLIPSLALPETNSKQYLEVVSRIDALLFKQVRDILSGKTSSQDTKK